jgi:tight adherence protein C
MTAGLVGAGLGVLGATGVVTAVRAVPPLRRIRLEDRMAPYLRTDARGRRPTGASGLTGLAACLLRPMLHALARRLNDVIGGTASVQRRLEQSGNSISNEEFRVEQVLWAGAGLGIGLVLALLAAVRGSTTGPVAFLIMALVLAVAGAMLRDRRLTSAVTGREERIIAEFPTVAELLALAVGAGESPVGALQRVSRQASGALSEELGRALAEVGAGGSLIVALEAMSRRTSVPALSRFVDGLAVAVERGTPLADVLRAQAADARDERRRALLEAGGRKEIAMMIPVVFFVLPVTVVFALFPGFYTLHLAVP